MKSVITNLLLLLLFFCIATTSALVLAREQEMLKEDEATVKSVPWTMAPSANPNTSCPVGRWGLPACDKPCHISCLGFECNPYNGVCQRGCYVPPDHSQLKYGLFCEQWCSRNCLSKTDIFVPGECDRFSGACPNGCQKGYWGDSCDKKCIGDCGDYGCDQSNGTCYCLKGKYNWPKCDKDCPENCLDGELTCHPVTGDCIYGCGSKDFIEHFYGPKCDTVCKNCLQGCDQKTGNCTCWPGLWGRPSCSNKCEKCGTCDPDSGVCLTCPAHKWNLPNCDMDCPYACLNSTTPQCDAVTGHCTQCNDEQGWWGAKCDQPCPKWCMATRACDIKSGTCDAGCGSAFNAGIPMWGPWCEQLCDQSRCAWCLQLTGECGVCVPGRYGAECNMTCSPNCKLNSIGLGCDRTTGLCRDDGCNDGWWGPKHCEKRCGNCKTCNITTGACLVECDEPKGKWCGAMCNEICGAIDDWIIGVGTAASVVFCILVVYLWGKVTEMHAAEQVLVEDAQVAAQLVSNTSFDRDAAAFAVDNHDNGTRDSAIRYRSAAEI